MILAELAEAIESHRFAAATNVASGLNGFIRAVRMQPETGALSRLLESYDGQAELLKRTVAVARRPIDLRYENPWDSALATYLLALHWADHNLAQVAAVHVQRAPQCWWAHKVAQYILHSQPFKADSGDREKRASLSAWQGVRTDSLNATESIVEMANDERWIGHLSEVLSRTQVRPFTSPEWRPEETRRYGKGARGSAGVQSGTPPIQIMEFAQ